jgi:acyl-CoA thioester hydrolase
MIEIHDDSGAIARTHKRLYRVELPLRFADMDADQHINNAEFYRYMEEARMQWVGSLGLPMTPPQPVPVLAASACQFRAPLHYPGDVTVEVYLGKMGRSSVRTHYLLLNGDTIAAEGYAVSVWVDPATGKSIELPTAIRALAGNNEPSNP